jgi:bifunctional non-homologous end joining protein LigD
MGTRRSVVSEGQPSWGLHRMVYPRASFRLRDVVEYYDVAAKYMLPYLRRHPVTLKRYPDEVAGDVYYDKDAPAFTPAWVKRHPVWRRTGESQIRYVVIRDARTLRWAAGVGTVEFHSFLGTVEEFEQPSYVVFDLDPGQGADIVNCARVALLLRDLLERLQLQSFVKASGSKGLQLYIPLNTPVSFAATQPFAKTVSALLAEQHPKEIISEMIRAERRGRVFIDWSQNADYKTTVTVYSLRAKRTTPFVSMPVRWEELVSAVESGSGHDLYFHPDVALRRLSEVGDLFRPVLELKQTLPEAFMTGTQMVRKNRPNKSPKVIALPNRSRQGSRRRFWLRRRKGRVELQIELHDQTLTFSMEGDLPRRKNVEISAELIRQTSAERIHDEGICEIVEGSLAKGHLRLYFAGDRLEGEWIFERKGGTWNVSKAASWQRGSGVAA